MPSAILVRCDCSHEWVVRAEAVDERSVVHHVRCPSCGRLDSDRTGRVVGVCHLQFAPNPARPMKFTEWKCTSERHGTSMVVSLSVECGREKLVYDIAWSSSCGFVGAMRFVGGFWGHVSRSEVPPHLIDLSLTIAADGPPVTDWQAFAEATVTRGGEEADA